MLESLACEGSEEQSGSESVESRSLITESS